MRCSGSGLDIKILYVMDQYRTGTVIARSKLFVKDSALIQRHARPSVGIRSMISRKMSTGNLEAILTNVEVRSKRLNCSTKVGIAFAERW